MDIDRALEAVRLLEDIRQRLQDLTTMLHRHVWFEVGVFGVILGLQVWSLILNRRVAKNVEALRGKIDEYLERVERLEILSGYEREEG